MVDVQCTASSSFVPAPPLYHATSMDVTSDTDSESLYDPAHTSPSSSPASPPSTAASPAASFHFGSALRATALDAAVAEAVDAEDDDDDEDDETLFAAYAEDTPLPLRTPTWTYNLPTSTPSPAATSPACSSKASDSASPRGLGLGLGLGLKQGIKRPLVATEAPLAVAVAATAATVPSQACLPPSVSIASSMLALNQPIRRMTPGLPMPTPSAVSVPAPSAAAATLGRRGRKDDDVKPTMPMKKAKVSRERQLKINAASRRCRKKQKLELQFLRTHVAELQLAMKEQVSVLMAVPSHEQRVARLALFLEQSARKVEEMSAGGRPGTTVKPTVLSEADLEELRSVATKAQAQAAQTQAQCSMAPGGAMHSQMQSLENEMALCMRPVWSLGKDKADASEDDIAKATEYALSAERKSTLLHIASFIRNNMALESQSFSPEVISCLPIEMDGWQLRLAITEKNYTIHNCKFFPCDVHDMFAFCWETNVASKTSVKQGANEYCVVTPLNPDVAYVYSKTIGKWSLSVHGVPNVSYNSLLCRMRDTEHNRAIICQQSVLEDRDFEDETTIPWLFKRWVVFEPRVVDGVQGTFVEAYRTASYATGRLIYSENNTYDRFCEHLIRRYAESNSLLERTMARDPRFQHLAAIDPSNTTAAAMEHEETTSDLLVKDLLLF